MNKKTSSSKKMALSSTRSIVIDPDLSKALDRIYKQYGRNLSAFFRDANKEAVRKSRKQPAIDDNPYSWR
jgi:metal-responsive CopG/Arc/MetJ family transcriptional regulator